MKHTIFNFDKRGALTILLSMLFGLGLFATESHPNAEPWIHGLRKMPAQNCPTLVNKDFAKLPADLQDLQNNVCSLGVALPANTSFTCFDYGLYAESAFYNEEAGQEFIYQNMLQEAESSSPFYMMIAKQHSTSRFNVIFKVKLKLPEGGCVTEDNVFTIERIVEDSMQVAFQRSGSDPNFTTESEIAGIKKLTALLTQLYASNNGNCCVLRSNAHVTSAIRGMGGRDLPETITVSSISGWTPPSGTSAQILDFAGYGVNVTTPAGETFSYADLSQALGVKITQVITREPGTLKVIITKDAPDNCIDNYDELKEVYDQSDFAIWIHFHSVTLSSGAAKMVFLGKAPKSGFENTGAYIEDVENPAAKPGVTDQEKIMIPILAWLAKGFTAAVIDASVQFFLNYVSGEDAWGAVSKINWKEVGWEGLIGCLPWGKSKWLAIGAQAFAAGVGVVVINYADHKYDAIAEDQVWYKVAEDFGRAAVVSLATNLAADLVSSMWKYFLRRKHCFVQGTPVFTPNGLRAIQNIHLGNQVLSSALIHSTYDDDDYLNRANNNSALNSSLFFNPEIEWFKVKFEVINRHSEKNTIVTLLRTKGWVESRNIKKDAYSFLFMPEMGLADSAKVVMVERYFDFEPLSKDSSGNCLPNYVTGEFERSVSDIFELHLQNGEIIQTTGAHPFYSAETSNWVEVKDLKIGENLKTIHGEKIAIDTILKKTGIFTVYNLEVTEQHNFFVGNSGLLVHNSYLDAIDDCRNKDGYPNSNKYPTTRALIKEIWEKRKKSDKSNGGTGGSVEKTMTTEIENIVFKHRYEGEGYINTNSLKDDFPGIDTYHPGSKIGVSIKTYDRDVKIDDPWLFDSYKKYIDDPLKHIKNKEINYINGNGQAQSLDIEDIELHIYVPEGFDQSMLKALKDYAKTKSNNFIIQIYTIEGALGI